MWSIDTFSLHVTLSRYGTNQKSEVILSFTNFQFQSKVSNDEWANLPEVGDARNRKQRMASREKYTPMSDSMLARNMGGENVTSIDPSSSMASPLPGTATGMLTSTGDLDLRKISQARNTLMDLKLKQTSDSVSGQTVVDPKGNLETKQS